MNPIKQVFRKEIREMMRDRRVRVSAFLMPALVIYMMFSLFGFLGNVIGKKENLRVHVVEADRARLSEYIKGFQVTTVPSLDAGIALVKSGKAAVLLAAGPATDQASEATVGVYYDKKQDLANLVINRVQEGVQLHNAERAKKLLSDRNIPLRDLYPVMLDKKPQSVGDEASASQLLVQILPYMLIMFAFAGGMSLATELVAGEKEKNTLETLLISPVRRTQIVLGKFLSLMSACLMSTCSALVGMFLFAKTQSTTSPIFQGGFGITPKALGIAFLVLLPMVALFAGLLMAISSYAKNTREAQTHLAVVNIIVVMPAVFSQFIGYTEFGNSFAINFVPILNTANSIRTALLGKPDMAGLAVTIAISLVLAAIGVRTAVTLFNREQVLTRV